MNKGDIVTVMSSIGEYIGKFNSYIDGGVSIDDPRLIVRDQDGKVGFGRGVCMSALENPSNVVFGDIIFVVKTNETFEKAWIEATSGIIV